MLTWMSATVGRATILEAKGQGLYSIALDYGTTEINTQIAFFQQTITELEASLPGIDDEIDDANAARLSAQSELNAAIALQDGDTGKGAVNEANGKLLQALATLDLLQAQKGRVQVSVSNLQARLEELQALQLTDTRDAWCADYTDEASGSVATIEIRGEQPAVLVAPEAPAPAAGDGALTQRLAMSPSATFINWAILPGWQKYSPTFRVGELTAVDVQNDLGDVALDPAISSAQTLDINQAESLSAVPIEYMNCNAAVFEVGDRVVVKFENQDWSQPKIIGFESNPKPCSADIWASITYVDGFTVTKQMVRYTDALEFREIYQHPASINTRDLTLAGPTNAAYLRTSSRAPTVRDAKTGTTLSAPSLSAAGSSDVFEALVITGDILYIHDFDTNAIVEMSWPDATELRRTPGSYVWNKSLAATADYVAAANPQAVVRLLDRTDLSVVWSVDINSLIVSLTGDDVQTQAVSMTDDYVVVLSFENTASEEVINVVRVFDIADGSLLTSWTRTLGGQRNRWFGCSVRGTNIYLIEENLSPSLRRDIVKFSLIDGDPNDPTKCEIAADVFGSLRPANTTGDSITGDTGSIA